MKPIKPGIYKDLPNKDYHADPALGSSMMGKLYEGVEDLKEYLDNPSKPTNAMMFGSAFHCKVLEPHLFDSLFEVVEKGGYKEKDGRILIPEEHGTSRGYNDILAMAEAIKNDEMASWLLSGGEAEVSYFWKHKLGFMCKVRPDYRKEAIVIDLKSTNNPVKDVFQWDIGNFGYHRQADHYMCGVAQSGISVEEYTIIAVQKKPPYKVRCHRLDEEDLSLGHKENKRLYKEYEQCLSTQVWKEPSRIRPISLPQKFIKSAKI